LPHIAIFRMGLPVKIKEGRGERRGRLPEKLTVHGSTGSPRTVHKVSRVRSIKFTTNGQ